MYIPSKAEVEIQPCGPQILPEHDGKTLLLQYGQCMAVRRAVILESGVILAAITSPASLVYFSNEELEECGMKLVGVVKRISVDVGKEKAPSGVDAPDEANKKSDIVFSVARMEEKRNAYRA